jgi:hypothetical protein
MSLLTIVLIVLAIQLVMGGDTQGFSVERC